MSRKHKFTNNDDLFFVTFTVVNWIDVFTRTEFKDLILDSIKYCQAEKGLEVYAWAIMTNHLHMIIGTNKNPFNEIVRDLKRFTSRKLKEIIYIHPKESRKEWIIDLMTQTGEGNSNNKSWQFWQQHNHPVQLYSPKVIRQKLDYIHLNPARAGFVEEPWYWKYSSAVDYYADKQGLLDIIMLEGLYFI